MILHNEALKRPTTKPMGEKEVAMEASAAQRTQQLNGRH